MPDELTILQRMESYIAPWREDGDNRVIFLSCYRLMTANVLTANEMGVFANPTWVSQLLRRFAGYYFDALIAFERHPDRTAPVWRFVFEAAQTGRYQPVQNLMLGVNAHINYDLVFTLVDMLQPEWNQMPAAQKQERYQDHCQVNAIIGQTIDSVQDQIIEPLSPGMAIVDAVLGPLDEWLTSRLISHWREEVWRNALAYLAAQEEADREAKRRHVEAMTLKRAEAITLSNRASDLRYLA